MKFSPRFLKFSAAVALLFPAFTGCETADGGGSGSANLYYGTGFYDPWYHGAYYGAPDIIVTPPIAHPSHPIQRPPVGARPTPMPSIPSAPRAMHR